LRLEFEAAQHSPALHVAIATVCDVHPHVTTIAKDMPGNAEGMVWQTN